MLGRYDMGLGLEPSSVLAGRAEEYKEKKEAEVQASNQLTRKYLSSFIVHLPSQLPLSLIPRFLLDPSLAAPTSLSPEIMYHVTLNRVICE
jgi:hypothetical protein